jgi:hypothetical protein
VETYPTRRKRRSVLVRRALLRDPEMLLDIIDVKINGQYAHSHYGFDGYTNRVKWDLVLDDLKISDEFNGSVLLSEFGHTEFRHPTLRYTLSCVSRRFNSMGFVRRLRTYILSFMSPEGYVEVEGSKLLRFVAGAEEIWHNRTAAVRKEKCNDQQEEAR